MTFIRSQLELAMEIVLKKLGLNPSTWEDAKEKYRKLMAPPQDETERKICCSFAVHNDSAND